MGASANPSRASYFVATYLLSSSCSFEHVWFVNPKGGEILGQPVYRSLADLPGTPDLVDVFRKLNDKPDQYTWWSNRGQAWKKNVGWRIDYQIATPGIAAKAKRESICRTRRFSDHAPLTIEYDHTL